MLPVGAHRARANPALFWAAPPALDAGPRPSANIGPVLPINAMRSEAALAFLRAAADKCASNRVSFTPPQRAQGLAILEQLHTLFATPTPSESDQSLLDWLPRELLVAVIRQLDNQSLVRLASTCRLLYADRTRPMTPVEEVLRLRAAERAQVLPPPKRLPARSSGWVPFLLRRDGLAYGQQSVAAGRGYSLFLDLDGRLLETGYYPYPYHDHTPRILELSADERFLSVVTNDWYALALSEDGRVYTWTWDRVDGRRPIPGSTFSMYLNMYPEIVPGLDAITVCGIAQGTYHCAVLTASGALYTWSSYEDGPIPPGLGYETDAAQFKAKSPRRVLGVLDGVRLRCVAAGYEFTLVASQEGQLFSFGDGKHGSLGHGDTESSVLPRRVEALSPARGEVVKHLAAFEGYEAMALTAQGRVFTWGSAGVKRPRLMLALRETPIQHISVGGGRAYAVTAEGALFTWRI